MSFFLTFNIVSELLHFVQFRTAGYFRVAFLFFFFYLSNFVPLYLENILQQMWNIPQTQNHILTAFLLY